MRNSQQHIGGGTIIDLYACINVLFVAFWLFSICARPTIVSTIHLFLFGVYVIFGGIILKGNGSRTKVWSHTALSVRKCPFCSDLKLCPFQCVVVQSLRQRPSSTRLRSKSSGQKKKRYKVELADLSEVRSLSLSLSLFMNEC